MPFYVFLFSSHTQNSFIFTTAVDSDCFIDDFIQSMLFNLVKLEIIIKQEI